MNKTIFDRNFLLDRMNMRRPTNEETVLEDNDDDG